MIKHLGWVIRIEFKEDVHIVLENFFTTKKKAEETLATVNMTSEMVSKKIVEVFEDARVEYVEPKEVIAEE